MREAEIVKEWHEALNACNSHKLLTLVNNNIKLAGPRGFSRGSDVLIDWMKKTRIQMKPLRYYCKGGTVITEEQVEWHNTETGELQESYTVASAFVVRESRVESIMRYSDLDNAFISEGFTENDAVTI